MDVLMVEDNTALSALWSASLRRHGARVTISASQAEAIGQLQRTAFDVLILSLGLSDGSPLAVADYAGYRRPETKIIPVTSDTFFSDGSVFAHVPNTCTTLASTARPDDMAAIVEHYGSAGVR
ncbi:response regulator [Oceaniglobus ichthyenteri]|uniref:response regulator n=1 Tax=Oceaniglobus ichthyenteri TaxID=2136177 RepID=UPI000D39009F|nr:response regulator [Oceaniglobus ichthyenteri]